jgi:hypothetical protein
MTMDASHSMRMIGLLQATLSGHGARDSVAANRGCLATRIARIILQQQQQQWQQPQQPQDSNNNSNNMIQQQ